MNLPQHASHNLLPSQEVSWACGQALAILAVDGIRPSNEGLDLMARIDEGSMTSAQAIELIVQRALQYAHH